MAAEFRNVGRPDADDCSTDTEWNQSETAMNSQTQIDLKAEKKVSHSASSIKLIELISLFSTLLRLFELFATLFNSLRFWNVDNIWYWLRSLRCKHSHNNFFSYKFIEWI